MKKILWVGLGASDEVYQELVGKGYFHFAAQSAQTNFITGIEKSLKKPVDMISGFMMPDYRRTKEIFTKPYTWRSSYGGEGKSVTNLNIKYADTIYRTNQMKKACRQWAQKHSNDEVTVFVYSAVNAYIKAALEVKKICKNARIYLIITDLPQFMELRPKKIKKILKDLDWHSLNRSIHECDGWIVFTKHMISYLNLPEEKCLVIEGSVNIDDVKEVITEKNDEKVIIMYSGSLGLQYGIPELLEAFEGIEGDNYELWFTGKGNAEDLIEEYIKKDSRIKSFGFLPSHDKLVDIQNIATMLISTRMPTEKASAYCFPSKLFEYMLLGKPVLSFKIKGIPDEYYQYLVVMDSPASEDIRNAIIKVGKMPTDDRRTVGIKARDFIINEKNNVTQSAKICAFVGLKNEDIENAF